MSTEPQVYTITRTLEIPVGLLRDIIVTACEGGIGYWSQLEFYNGPAISDGTLDLLRIRVVEYDGPDGSEFGEWMTLSLDKVAKGINTLLEKFPMSVAAKNIMGAVVGYEAGNFDYDADDADMVIQCALLGDIVYG